MSKKIARCSLYVLGMACLTVQAPEIRVVSGLTPPGEFIQVVTRDALRKNRQHKQDFMDYRQRVRE